MTSRQCPTQPTPFCLPAGTPTFPDGYRPGQRATRTDSAYSVSTQPRTGEGDREAKEARVEPRRVRKFLRQELLAKAGQSSWDAPRVFRYDLADEPEKEASLAAPHVVLVLSDSEQIQPEEQLDRRVVTIDAGSDTRVVLTQPLSSPIGSLPRTPGRDIQLPGYQEVSPR